MSIRVSSVRDEINERARSLFVSEVDEDGSYIFPNVSAFAEYGGPKTVEPMLPVDDLFELGDHAYATVNKYNAIVLNSQNLFIADVDFGDPRLSKFATVPGTKQVLANVVRLFELDDDLRANYGWEHLDQLFGQSFRVYRTHSGCRIICTSMTFDRKDTAKRFLGDRLLRFLQADPKYAALCEMQQTYRARLTPKPWRVSESEPHHVCDFVEAIGGTNVHPELAEQLRFHDEMTLAVEPGSELA